jgi:hypothetical protein
MSKTNNKRMTKLRNQILIGLVILIIWDYLNFKTDTKVSNQKMIDDIEQLKKEVIEHKHEISTGQIQQPEGLNVVIQNIENNSDK